MNAIQEERKDFIAKFVLESPQSQFIRFANELLKVVGYPVSFIEKDGKLIQESGNASGEVSPDELNKMRRKLLINPVFQKEAIQNFMYILITKVSLYTN